ncbi:hypothetical protein SY83_18050 [Paenibacillus swuensis]|uniref:AB hydrolase-1 domain-containing protein n=1 Tax=Paenibacillus swuensis TaxID=1178515 RepID=A0A172TLH2_9BACL|nr:alpha/beta fold hydrolase [Paenibacillus swuensis]ANE47880.1 hypothetical protein SY83_18050 [Paenibacillus swuensis]
MNERACLLIHGFTGGPHEVRPLAIELTNMGYICNVPLLPGHGDRGNGLRNITWQSWVEHVEREAAEMQRLYGSFDVIGFSMGGLLAAYIANRYAVRRVVLLSAAVIYVSPVRFAHAIADLIRTGETRKLKTVKRTPIGSVWQFMRLVRALKPEFSRIQSPTLVLQGERDEIVHPSSARFITSKLNCYYEVQYYANSKHLICLDADYEQVFRRVTRFLYHEFSTTE